MALPFCTLARQNVTSERLPSLDLSRRCKLERLHGAPTTLHFRHDDGSFMMVSLH
jgi:hypothetical protein